MSGHAIPDQEAWDAWHPAALATRLAKVNRPWCVVGGWALDLWHGRLTRDHHDLEFTVLREDFDHFRRALVGMEFYTVHAGIFRFLPEGAGLDPAIFQIWCWDIGAKCWRVDMMIEPGTPETWACKRDLTITRPRTEMIMRSAEGVPCLGPAAILLLKAKHLRPKDKADFDTALPELEASERLWLKTSLAKLHPGHIWIERL